VLKTCTLFPNTKETYLKGLDLLTKYDFQIFDAIVVASALEAGCNKLYTEDMHPGLVVENNLQIVNPFL
jgi:predicted nucleic acid-binding protein